MPYSLWAATARINRKTNKPTLRPSEKQQRVHHPEKTSARFDTLLGGAVVLAEIEFVHAIDDGLHFPQ